MHWILFRECHPGLVQGTALFITVAELPACILLPLPVLAALSESHHTISPACVCRSCTAYFGPDQAWRCFFAQYAWRLIPLDVIFHVYLYEYANLAYDQARPADYEEFRAQLTRSLLADEHQQSIAVLSDTKFHPFLADRPAANVSCGCEAQVSNASGSLHPDALHRNLMHGRHKSVHHGNDCLNAVVKPQEQVRSVSVAHIKHTYQAMETLEIKSPWPELLHTEQALLSTRVQNQHRLNVFAPACHLHEMIDSSLFESSCIDGLRFDLLLKSWFNGSRTGVHMLDTHAGIRRDCTQICKS